jgi:hypothetical protein
LSKQPSNPRGPEVSPAIAGTIRSLAVDQVTAEVVGALAARGVVCILLKGPVLARWLYGDGTPRGYVDSDLLIAPEDRGAAELVMGALGFAKRLDDADTPGWRQAAHHWTRGRDGANVDLHRTLMGVGVADQELWRALGEETEAMAVSGTDMLVLSAPARALHLALHAAQHGVRGGKHLRDLERGLELIEPELWAAAARLAERLRATPAFAGGLRLTEAGAAVAERLALPHERSVQEALLAGIPVAGALGWNDLARTAGIRARLRFVARKLVPTRRFMRAWSPLARRGPLGLAAAYVWRPIWLLRSAAPGFVAWRRAGADGRRARRRP